MNQDTFNKYTLFIKDNKYIWKHIWSINNNTIRNTFITNNYISILKNYSINYYFLENLIVGMPKLIKNKTIDIYLNKYDMTLDIEFFDKTNEITRSNILYKNIKYSLNYKLSDFQNIFLRLSPQYYIKNSCKLQQLIDKIYKHHIDELNDKINIVVDKYNIKYCKKKILSYLSNEVI